MTIPPPSFMSRKVVLEVCIDSLESATAAVEGGADRLEVCNALTFGGGTTPTLGLVRSIRKAHPQVPLMVMIRPRVGDFCYAESELEVMEEDIEIFRKENGIHGVVLGVLKRDGYVDIEKTRRLVRMASPLQVTFHRAFDMTRDAERAYRDISSIGGITSILTSGLAPKAIEAVATLQRLQILSMKPNDDPPPQILPGSGINVGTIEELCRTLSPEGGREFHMSGGSYAESEVLDEAKKEGMGMGEDGKLWKIWKTDACAVREVKSLAEAQIMSLQG